MQILTMTNQQHPITPPPELVQQWADMLASRSDEAVFTRAAQWGADQELEACCEWFTSEGYTVSLRAARRPKPPSLKEQALYELDELFTAIKQLGVFNPPKSIRQALEQLND